MTNAAKKTVSARKRKPREQTTTRDLTPKVTVAHVTEEKPRQKANLKKGQMMDVLSKQWMKRPNDERFLSIEELAKFVKSRYDRSREIIATMGSFKAKGDFLTLVTDNEEIPVAPTHYAFRQMCELLPAPADYISKRPLATQQMLLNEHLSEKNSDGLKVLIRNPEDSNSGRPAELAAITNATYGRVWDYDIVKALQWLLSIDPTWKVPGEFNWKDFVQNPYVETTKGNTTLFASDRDIFAFLCKDDQPIECGKNPDGSTDVYFPGFYTWGSETGNGSGGVATMMLRGICANRCLWGVENFKSFRFRHSKNAGKRFEEKATLAMRSLQEAEFMPFVKLVEAAKAKRIAKTAEEANEFLHRLGFWKHEQKSIVEACQQEEEREPRTAYDFFNGITAFARRAPHNDARLQIEAKAEKVLEMAA